MKRTISLLILISLLLMSAVGCGIGKGEEQKKTDEEQTEVGEERTLQHFAKKVIDSYESLVSAWDIIEKRELTLGDIPTYTVNDNLGEGYKVLYYFERPCCDTYYPIGFEEFFSNQTDGFFTTKIYLLNDEGYQSCCDDEPHSHDLLLYKEDEDYERFSAYNGNPVIDIWGYYAVEIENKELISLVEEKKTENGRFEYSVYYGEDDILEIESCVVITDDLLDLIIDNLEILGEKSAILENGTA